MYINVEEPKEKISLSAAKVWRISNLLEYGSLLVVLVILLICADQFGWYQWISNVLYILLAVSATYLLFSVSIQPTYVQRSWRYQIDPKFVQLKHGRWTEKHTLIPMEKVEYVRSEQGPILRRYGLYNIEVGTTTTSHVIPAIPSEEAKNLKALIATYAKIVDLDEAEGDKKV